MSRTTSTAGSRSRRATSTGSGWSWGRSTSGKRRWCSAPGRIAPNCAWPCRQCGIFPRACECRLATRCRRSQCRLTVDMKCRSNWDTPSSGMHRHMTDQPTSSLLDMTVGIVANYLSNNNLAPERIGNLISSTHAALASVGRFRVAWVRGGKSLGQVRSARPQEWHARSFHCPHFACSLIRKSKGVRLRSLARTCVGVAVFDNTNTGVWRDGSA